MTYAFLLLKENTPLSREEALALCDPKKSELIENLLLVERESAFSPEQLTELKERLALTYSIHEILFSCPVDELESKSSEFDWKKIYSENFCVRIHQLCDHGSSKMNIEYPERYEQMQKKLRERELGEKSADLPSEKKIAGIVWRSVDLPKVKLKDAKTKIVIFVIDGKAYATCEIVSIDSEYNSRRSHKRIFGHSSSLHPRLARALVNLTGARRGEIVYDPCCGSGGFLIEAGLIGLIPYGSDVSRKMYWGSMRNMAQRKLSNYHVEVKDIFKIEGVKEYIITDLPYGMNSIIVKEDKSRVTLKSEKGGGVSALEEFYLKVFLKIREILGKKAVIMLPHFVDYKEIAKKAGLTIRSEFSMYVHKSLTRKILVLTK